MALLRQCNWTSASAERQHASGATIRKFHAELGAPMLVVRSYLHGLQQLMPAKASAEEKMLQKLQGRLDKALAARPRAITGRHVYLQDAFLKAQQRQETGLRGEYNRFKIMRLHSAYYHQLSPDDKALLSSRAQLLQAEAVQKQQQEVETLLQEMQEQSAKATCKARGSPSMRLSACRFSPQDLVLFEEAYGSLAATSLLARL